MNHVGGGGWVCWEYIESERVAAVMGQDGITLPEVSAEEQNKIT